MLYWILENENKNYLKQINKDVIETTEHLHLAYKFSCEKSALVFKEANKLENFKICKCRYF